MRNPTTEAQVRKFRNVIEYLQRYASKRKVNWPPTAAQAYKESQLDHSRRSPAGAVGIMQIKPSTGWTPMFGSGTWKSLRPGASGPRPWITSATSYVYDVAYKAIVAAREMQEPTANPP